MTGRRSASGLKAAALAIAGSFAMTQASADPSYHIMEFSELHGWQQDDHQAALDVFLNTCTDLKRPEWATLCAVAQKVTNAKAFFELFFRPVIIGGEAPALFTGYFEPELNGARTPSDRFRYPLYAKPPEASGQWYTRQEIESGGMLEGRGLEIAWVDDPVDLFFLQIQGSGRVRLADGDAIRVGYGGANGQPYRSVGTELIRRGIFQPHQVSAQVIRNWVKRNPVDGQALLHHNPSYVFFRKVTGVPADQGPLGAMNRSITTLRSVAIDPAFTPLGAPVWIEKEGRRPLHRLMVAQDTGSAIKGPQRADVFYGTGNKAGRAAGRIRDRGRVVVLLPIELAYSLTPEG